MIKARSIFIKRHSLILFLLLLGVAQVSIEMALGGFDSFPDTEAYLETVAWFKNGTGEEYPLRIQRPLQIIAVLAFEPLVGAETGFVITNSLFYLLSIPFFFRFSRGLHDDQAFAFVSTLLFEFSFCVLYWGLALLTDMLLWLFVVICFDLLVRISDEWKLNDMIKLSLITGIGLLNKESLIIVPLILAFLFFKRKLSPIEGTRMKGRALATLSGMIGLMILPFSIVQAAMFLTFGPGHTFFDYHVTHNIGDLRGEIWYIPVTILISFNVMLLFYIPGLREFIRCNSFLSRGEYLVSLALASTPILIFEQYSPRLSFLLFPFIVPVAALQLTKIIGICSHHYSRICIGVVFLVCYTVVNNAIALFGDDIRELLGIWPRL